LFDHHHYHHYHHHCHQHHRIITIIPVFLQDAQSKTGSIKKQAILRALPLQIHGAPQENIYLILILY
jgi:hypothetical protein